MYFVSSHYSDPTQRALWLQGFEMREEDVKYYMRICSRHFPDGDSSKAPSTTLSKGFASPTKKGPSVSYQLSAYTFVRFRTYPRNASWQRLQCWRKFQG